MLTIGKPYVKKMEDKSRLISEITVDGKVNKIFVEVDSIYEKYLCYERSDAFLIPLFYYGMKYNHDITCEAPVSEDLYYQITEYLIPLLKRNSHNNLFNINIKCETANNIENRGAVGVGLTCGVDSFNSILSNIDNKLKSRKITHFTIMSAADSYKKNGAYESINSSLHKKAADVAKIFNIPLIDMYSNMRSIFPIPPMHTLIRMFGVYSLQKLFGVYYFSSGYPVWTFNMEDCSVIDSARYDLLLCKELSTRNLFIYSEGSQKNRLEKIKFISKYDIVKNNLHVCTREATNCSLCSKCIRTILALDSIDKLEDFKNVFDLDYYYKNQNYYFSEAVRAYKQGDLFVYDFIDKLAIKYKDNEIFKEISNSKNLCGRCYRMSDYKVYKKSIKKIIIGISGGSGSGKSTVVNYFSKEIEDSKIIKLDKDMIKLLNEYKDRIITELNIPDDGKHWCGHLYDNHNTIKKWFKIIENDFNNCIEEKLCKADNSIIIIDSFLLPLLDVFNKCDYKIIVKSKFDNKLPRVVRKIEEANRMNKYDEISLVNRINNTDLKDYNSKFNYIINNDGTLDELKVCCDDTIKDILKK